jgi:hypothetical protein
MGGLFGNVERLTPVLPGVIISVEIQGQQVLARYRIDNPPLGMPLKVTVQIQRSFTSLPGVTAGRTSGPDVFTLNVTDSSEVVDFGVGALTGPH